ncbi:MAG: hypothetical protein GWN37_16545 [Gammaproteobacteria bacterium]|nr:hypothetical protein [Gammaproteobacteria bacterium]
MTLARLAGDLLLGAARRGVRAAPECLFANVVTQALGPILALDGGLEPLEGRRVEVVISDAPARLRFEVAGGCLRSAAGHATPHARIEARLANLVLLALQAEDADTLFFHRRLSLEGETETAVYVKNLLDGLDLDPEVVLRAFLGARAGALVAGLRRSGLGAAMDVATAKLPRALGAVARAMLAEPADETAPGAGVHDEGS